MHLAGKISRTILWVLLLVSLLLVSVAGFTRRASAQAGSQIYYSVEPTTGGIRPNDTITLTVTLHNQAPIGAGSVHVSVEQGSYVSFQPINSGRFIFSYYHQVPNDFVYVCTENTCAPGTHQIARITLRAGSSGTMRVTLTPKETADPNRNLIQASGASANFSINSSAPPSTSNPRPSTGVIVPQDNGNGGATPTPVTDDQYQDRVDQVQKKNNDSIAEDDSDSFWSPGNILLFGVAVGIGIGAVIFFLFRLFGGSSRRRDPPYMNGSGSSGPTAFVG